jgi:hypothetical protein
MTIKIKLNKKTMVFQSLKKIRLVLLNLILMLNTQKDEVRKPKITFNKKTTVFQSLKRIGSVLVNLILMLNVKG